MKKLWMEIKSFVRAFYMTAYAITIFGLVEWFCWWAWVEIQQQVEKFGNDAAMWWIRVLIILCALAVITIAKAAYGEFKNSLYWYKRRANQL